MPASVKCHSSLTRQWLFSSLLQWHRKNRKSRQEKQFLHTRQHVCCTRVILYCHADWPMYMYHFFPPQAWNPSCFPSPKQYRAGPVGPVWDPRSATTRTTTYAVRRQQGACAAKATLRRRLVWRLGIAMMCATWRIIIRIPTPWCRYKALNGFDWHLINFSFITKF